MTHPQRFQKIIYEGSSINNDVAEGSTGARGIGMAYRKALNGKRRLAV